METHNESDAIVALKRLHTALPHSTWVLTQLGAAQWAAGRYSQAMSTFSQVRGSG
jgi:Flp pilus assembly protein TadD